LGGDGRLLVTEAGCVVTQPPIAKVVTSESASRFGLQLLDIVGIPCFAVITFVLDGVDTLGLIGDRVVFGVDVGLPGELFGLF
jgi:hypothetical protein